MSCVRLVMASQTANPFVNHNLIPVIGHWLPGLLSVTLVGWLFLCYLFFSIRSTVVVCNGTTIVLQPSILT